MALSLMLDAARRRQGCETLALADAEGLLVAGAGHFVECEELAAYAPFWRDSPKKRARPALQTLDVDGSELVLIASRAKQPDLGSVAQGCLRILQRKLPRPLTSPD